MIIRIVFLFLIVSPVLSLPLGILSLLVDRGFDLLTNWIPALFG